MLAVIKQQLIIVPFFLGLVVIEELMTTVRDFLHLGQYFDPILWMTVSAIVP